MSGCGDNKLPLTPLNRIKVITLFLSQQSGNLKEIFEDSPILQHLVPNVHLHDSNPQHVVPRSEVLPFHEIMVHKSLNRMNMKNH